MKIGNHIWKGNSCSQNKEQCKRNCVARSHPISIIQSFILIGFMLGGGACSAPSENSVPIKVPISQKTIPATGFPKRIISLDFCADQYVLQLAKRSSIIALSSDATAEFSYLRDQAKGISKLEKGLEQALLLKPDLIVRSYGGGPNADQFFERLNIPVLNLRWTNSLEEVKTNILHIARGLQSESRGIQIVKEIERRQQKIINSKGEHKNKPTLLYVTPTGYTTGPGSLVADSIEQAGYQNYITETGWRALPLERLLQETPDHIAASFFDLQSRQPANWSTVRHPVAKNLLKTMPRTALDGAWTACGASFIMDAIEAMAKNKTPAGREDHIND